MLYLLSILILYYATSAIRLSFLPKYTSSKWRIIRTLILFDGAFVTTETYQSLFMTSIHTKPAEMIASFAITASVALATSLLLAPDLGKISDPDAPPP